MTDSDKLVGGSTGKTTIASILDNVVWHALTGPHAPLALGGAAARRYPVDIAPFCATRDSSEQSMHVLARLTAGDPHVTLFTPERPVLTREFELVRSFTILQMIANSEVATSKDDRVSLLDATDDQEMTALAEDTKPGPWRRRTHELGRFYGIRIGGELVAMAGERMQVTGASEISAVCTRDSHTAGRATQPWSSTPLGPRFVRVVRCLSSTCSKPIAMPSRCTKSWVSWSEENWCALSSRLHRASSTPADGRRK